MLERKRVGFFRKRIEKDVCYIRYILTENGTFLSFKSFEETYGISTDYITYTGCLQAVKCYIRKTGLNVENDSSVYLIKDP